MNKATSIYLDATRFVAALVVFFYHLPAIGIIDTDFRVTFGRQAVLVFFVLSGYVIAYVTDKKESRPSIYLISRFSRLYSVALPALALTIVLDFIGMQQQNHLYEPGTHDQVVLRIGASVLFINQIWNFTIIPLSNGPFWSVAFEFWYYMLFAAYMFLDGKRKWLLVVALCLFIGPRILLLMPLWLFGVYAYHLHTSKTFAKAQWAIIFPVSIITMFLILYLGNPLSEIVSFLRATFPSGYVTIFGLPVFIGGSLSFPADYLFGLAFTISILSSSSFFSLFHEKKWLTRTIRFLSSYTFSTYLYHVPFLLFFHAIYAHDPNSGLSIFVLLTSVVFSIFLLGNFTEHKKRSLHKLMDSIFIKISNGR